MKRLYIQKKWPCHPLVILLMVFVFATACQSTASEANTAATMIHEEEMNGMAASDGHGTAMRQFVPNDGATVRIAAPANEASFKSSDTVPVIIETTNFTIGEIGNHWHIYLDGSPIMVMGGNIFNLQNLSVGHHDIQVYLSNGHHEDLEQGDQVTIMVEE